MVNIIDNLASYLLANVPLTFFIPKHLRNFGQNHFFQMAYFRGYLDLSIKMGHLVYVIISKLAQFIVHHCVLSWIKNT